ncbi:undecaprenyl-diphosphate phosphatase [Geothermobacter hydrogeniphilus]|uniref:Undecaprenyl-diphosphatase n=1 Tax=Geothermobacter hydrogeniphilus TaxID=1969733 RepID=A0A1X0XXU5_9BACT|nr:undecaprenyl-diphosphate phosphatase [Geothermobacter hydrogeniphilus]ORJ57676.1 UDP-diphosphatase [Geothermobacter hydrogeniphilus]
MTLGQAVFLGVVQGVAEFLPISSSGHLAIAQHYLRGFEQPGVLFDVLLHLGTMLAVVIYFRSELAALIVSPLRRTDEQRKNFRLLGLLLLASIPTGIIGLTFKETFEGLFDNIPLVASMLLVTGTLLFICERFRNGRRDESRLTAVDAILVGIAQGLSIMPGISRSGSTIATLLLRGVEGETAARFSFLLALPAVGGATLLSIRDLQQVATGTLPAYLAGATAAFIVGLFSIHLLMGVIRRRRLAAFGIYCWAVGLLVLLLNL